MQARNNQEIQNEQRAALKSLSGHAEWKIYEKLLVELYATYLTRLRRARTNNGVWFASGMCQGIEDIMRMFSTKVNMGSLSSQNLDALSRISGHEVRESPIDKY